LFILYETSTITGNRFGSEVTRYSNHKLVSRTIKTKSNLFKDRIEKPAPSIIERSSINQAVETGILVLDSLFPIGRGQRQLIIGDKKTGKTTLALDLILTQSVCLNNQFLDKKMNVFSVYVSIGQKEADVLNILLFFKKYHLVQTTSVIAATAANSAPLQFLAPFVGCTIGEFYRNNGLSSVVVYDDLSKHATAYRQLALLLRRPPGREAFPSDIFYLHARLLERAGKLASRFGSGSLTAFPIVETQTGDISAYIPTNIISITDGQIFLDYDLFSKGHRPAVNTGLSVSRIGSSAQSKVMKAIVGPFKLLVAQLKELERFESFASDLDQNIRDDITRGKILQALLRQAQHVALPILTQVFLIVFGCTVELEDTTELTPTNYGFFFKDFLRFFFSNDAIIGSAIRNKLNHDSIEALRIANNWQLGNPGINPFETTKLDPKVLAATKKSLKDVWLPSLISEKLCATRDSKKYKMISYINFVVRSIIANKVVKAESRFVYPKTNDVSYNFNYWTATAILPYYLPNNNIIINAYDYLLSKNFNEALPILDVRIIEAIAPFSNINDLEFYQDPENLDFFVELLTFVAYDLSLESKNTMYLDNHLTKR
jgi:proton translocating ATP synthase F1 alpha subunit